MAELDGKALKSVLLDQGGERRLIDVFRRREKLAKHLGLLSESPGRLREREHLVIRNVRRLVKERPCERDADEETTPRAEPDTYVVTLPRKAEPGDDAAHAIAVGGSGGPDRLGQGLRDAGQLGDSPSGLAQLRDQIGSDIFAITYPPARQAATDETDPVAKNMPESMDLQLLHERVEARRVALLNNVDKAPEQSLVSRDPGGEVSEFLWFGYLGERLGRWSSEQEATKDAVLAAKPPADEPTPWQQVQPLERPVKHVSLLLPECSERRRKGVLIGPEHPDGASRFAGLCDESVVVILHDAPPGRP